MGQSHVRNYVHLIYSTKGRRRWLRKELRDRLFTYQAGIFHKIGCPAMIVGGVEDHVHALFSLSKNVTLATLVRNVKANSSAFAKTLAADLAAFAWQKGYSAFSVSQSRLGQVKEYIAQQEDHHRKMSFQDELRKLLAAHHVEYDEQYVWE